MPDAHSNKFQVEVDGNVLPADLEHFLRNAVVEDNLSLPDMFVLTFDDTARTLLKDAHISIGSRVTISLLAGADASPEKLMMGEVTALEAQYQHDGTRTVVRGFDHSHRLFRGRITETYKDVTASDVATKVAKRAGLDVGTVDSTSAVQQHVSQANLNDWRFLKRLTQDIGYEAAVVDGKFEFRAPTDSAVAPDPSHDLAPGDPLQLKLGAELLRFQAIVTSAEQVKEVQVRGWDVTQKKALVGSAPAVTKSAALSIAPTDLAARFGNPTYVEVSTPYGSQIEVDAAAKSIAEQIAGAFVEFEGVARGNPKLKAGTAISIGLVGEPFDGKYTLTSTRHVYDLHEGYVTWFTASGRQERSLLGLTSAGASTGNGSAGDGRIGGVVVAQVTDVNDPDKLCRVKLKFPWLSDTYESDWARTTQPGAGKDRGAVILPEVNDEVLVAFEHGDVRRPHVVGSLYNGVDTPKLGEGLMDGSTGAVKRRGFISKKGAGLVFFDDDSKEGVALFTGDKSLRVSLNKSKTTIRITSGGQVQIEGAGDVAIKSGTKLSIEASSSLELKAPNVSIKGDSQVEVKAGAAMNVEGAQLSLKGSATADIDGGGMCNVHAALVKIN